MAPERSIAPSGEGLAATVAEPESVAVQERPNGVLCGFLVSYQHQNSGEYWPLYAGTCIVGRVGGDLADIELHHSTISSRHASLHIEAQSGMITVEDQDSTNGTFINTERLPPHERRRLKDGDRLQFGGFTAMIKVIGMP